MSHKEYDPKEVRIVWTDPTSGDKAERGPWGPSVLERVYDGLARESTALEQVQAQNRTIERVLEGTTDARADLLAAYIGAGWSVKAEDLDSLTFNPDGSPRGDCDHPYHVCGAQLWQGLSRGWDWYCAACDVGLGDMDGGIYPIPPHESEGDSHARGAQLFDSAEDAIASLPPRDPNANRGEVVVDVPTARVPPVTSEDAAKAAVARWDALHASDSIVGRIVEAMGPPDMSFEAQVERELLQYGSAVVDTEGNVVPDGATKLREDGTLPGGRWSDYVEDDLAYIESGVMTADDLRASMDRRTLRGLERGSPEWYARVRALISDAEDIRRRSRAESMDCWGRRMGSLLAGFSKLDHRPRRSRQVRSARPRALRRVLERVAA